MHYYPFDMQVRCNFWSQKRALNSFLIVLVVACLNSLQFINLYILNFLNFPLLIMLTKYVELLIHANFNYRGLCYNYQLYLSYMYLSTYFKYCLSILVLFCGIDLFSVWLICGSSHIRSVEISVKPRNFCQTLDVYLHLFFQLIILIQSHHQTVYFFE